LINDVCINFTIFDLRNLSLYSLKPFHKSKFAYKIHDLFKNEGIKVYKMTDFTFLRNISNDIELNYCLISLFKESNIYYSFDLVNPRLDIYSLKVESEYEFKISQTFDKNVEKYVNSVELINTISHQSIFLSLSFVEEEMILIKKNQKEMDILLKTMRIPGTDDTFKSEKEKRENEEKQEKKTPKKIFNMNFTSDRQIDLENLSRKDIKKLKKMKKMTEGNNESEISDYSNTLNEELLSVTQENNELFKKIEFITQKINAINIRLKKPPMIPSQAEFEEDTDSEDEIFSVGEYTLKDTINDNKRINFAMQKLKDLNIIDEDNDIVRAYFERFNKIDRQELESLFKENIKIKKLRVKNKDRFKTKGGSNIPLVTDIKDIYEQVEEEYEDYTEDDSSSSEEDEEEVSHKEEKMKKLLGLDSSSDDDVPLYMKIKANVKLHEIESKKTRATKKEKKKKKQN